VDTRGAPVVNRRQRRAGGNRRPLTDIERERVLACPDCNGDVTVAEVAPRAYHAFVQHDECCPWFAAFKRNGGLGVRFVRSEDDPEHPADS
jgi:hypothetical protein